MLKFQNPFYVEPVVLVANAIEPRAVAWLQTQTTNRVITIAELRAALPADAGAINREVFNIICKNIGAVIENPEDGAQ